MTDDPRFWLLDYSTEDHQDDLANTVRDGALIGVVDEDAGGIIAWALGDENAQLIIAALRSLA